MNKVTLVNPRILDTPNHPLGILYLAAVLERNGYNVKVVDPNFDDSATKVCDIILETEPDFIAFGATTPQIDFALEIAKKIREANLEVPIIFGGVHPTALPNETLKEDCVDYAAVGEGEITMLELINALSNKKPVNEINGLGYKENNRLIFNKPRKLIEDLDTLPFPARHLLPSRWYFAPPRIRGVWTKSTATVMATRGCPYRCIYCGSHSLFGRKVRFRSAKNVIDELKELRDRFGIDSVWFADDTFTVNPSWVKEFCRELKKVGWKDFKWACQARVNTVSYDLLKEMKSAGCVQLDFGVESGSPKVLKILKKDITPEKVIEAFDTAKKAGLLRFASFLIGTPGEKNEDIQMTYDLVKKIKPDYADFFFITPYPGTELFEIVKNKGLFKDAKSFNEWLMTKHADEPVMALDLSAKELINWRSKLHNMNFWRNYKNLMKNPRFIIGGIKIIFLGIGGFPQGVKRLFATGKIDSLFVEILKSYRNRLKRIY